MIGKNFVSRLAIAPPRRGLVTAVVYGLSLAVRFTSAVGEEVEIPPHAALRSLPLVSMMTGDSVRLPYQDWGHKVMQPSVLRHGWLLSSPASGCAAP